MESAFSVYPSFPSLSIKRTGIYNGLCILVAAENNEPMDEAIFSEVMFDKTTSGEMPEHQEFIYEINSKGSGSVMEKMENVAGIEGINIVSGVNI